MPIKEIDGKKQQPFIDLVDKIILAKKENNNSSTLEKKLDAMVYQLYDLTKDEIKVIEDSGNNKKVSDE